MKRGEGDNTLKTSDNLSYRKRGLRLMKYALDMIKSTYVARIVGRGGNMISARKRDLTAIRELSFSLAVSFEQ